MRPRPTCLFLQHHHMTTRYRNGITISDEITCAAIPADASISPPTMASAPTAVTATEATAVTAAEAAAVTAAIATDPVTTEAKSMAAEALPMIMRRHTEVMPLAAPTDPAVPTRSAGQIAAIVKAGIKSVVRAVGICGVVAGVIAATERQSD